MSQPINQTGNFRGQIVEFGVYSPESGAVGISIKAQLDEVWNAETKEWDDWRQYDVEADGTIWVVAGKEKGNKVLQGGVESLVKYTGWDGSIESMTDGTWRPTPCQLVINEDKYKDEVRYRISFVNDYERTPGAVGNVTPEHAKALQAQYGSQFRALAGNSQRNAAAPATKPKAPVAVKHKPKPATTADVTAKQSAPPQEPSSTKARWQFPDVNAQPAEVDDGIPF